jgi:hypothetical protein
MKQGKSGVFRVAANDKTKQLLWRHIMLSGGPIWL